MFPEELPVAGPVLETARASVLSPQLTLQMQLGNCVEAVLLLSQGVRSDAIARVVSETARQLRNGAEDTSGDPRTVEQTASALGVLQAANLASLSDDRSGTSNALRALADQLEAALTNTPGAGDDSSRVEQLASLHTVLAGLTGLRPDETSGLGRVM